MKFKELPYLTINSNQELDVEKIILNKSLFEKFQEYIQSAYNFCSKTNPFSPYTYEKIHSVKDRTAFQQVIGLLDSKAHEKILQEALEKECKVHLHFTSPQDYKKIELKLENICEGPIIDSKDLKFGFSEDEEITLNTSRAIVNYKRDLIRNSDLKNTNNKALGMK
jgi:hypothetical protein